MSSPLTDLQSVVMGLLQGVSELFPISSLGHSVVFPALFGWNNLVAAQSAKHSFFLTFLVSLHVATALALIVYFRNEWVKIISAFFRTIKKRRIDDKYERLAWLLVVATIPAGIVGLIFDHVLKSLFAKPLAASIFLIVNGGILITGEAIMRRAIKNKATISAEGKDWAEGERPLATLQLKEGVIIGVAQIFALFAGISRSGVTMVAGLVRGLDHEDAARFSFLLATPIILAAGLYKLPEVFGSTGNGVRVQMLIGGVAAFIAAFISVSFLSRYFKTKNLLPFAVYSIVAGIALTIRFY